MAERGKEKDKDKRLHGKLRISKWSGEFIPDPQEQQKNMQEVSYDQLVYSAVDPSGARITDVPAKPKPAPVPIEQTTNGPTTKQNQKGTRGGGGKGRGGKAYGPKVTYRPPKWD